jgi:hypothetical protein
VSSFGRVYSLKNEILLKPELLKSRTDYYLRVDIQGLRILLHVLVAFTFKNDKKFLFSEIITNQDIQVNHINLNTLDCAADNVEFCTQSENQLHSSYYRKIKFGGTDYVLKRSGE